MKYQNAMCNLYNYKLECIWTFPFDEGEDNELILDPKCIYFEIDNKFVEIYDVLGEGKIKVAIRNKIMYETDLDIAYKIDIRNYVLNYPETDYYIKAIGGIKVIEEANGFICDALQLNVYTENYGKQIIFIHSGIYGLRIGGSDMKNNWIKSWYIPVYGDNIIEKWF
ncbi:MAG: hypothetical protein IKK33_17310 [Lachnospiraceae bacterium]|nr:hypothetical protein [Lachnospiraceae bacterium]